MAADFVVWGLTFCKGLSILDSNYIGIIMAGESKILELQFNLAMSYIPSFKSKDLRRKMVLLYLFGKLILPSFSFVELLVRPFVRSSNF